MEIPKGLPKNLLPQGNNHICELLQSLYGLRQSANLWNHKVKDFVTSIGFTVLTADPSIFMNQRGIIIALYVDNILVFRKDKKSINAVKTKLKAFYLMKDSGMVRKILRIQVTWYKDRISLDQEIYAEQILAEFRIEDSKPQKLPLSPSINLNEDLPRLSRELHSEY
jgi:hypothetical protein